MNGLPGFEADGNDHPRPAEGAVPYRALLGCVSRPQRSLPGANVEIRRDESKIATPISVARQTSYSTSYLKTLVGQAIVPAAGFQPARDLPKLRPPERRLQAR